MALPCTLSLKILLNQKMMENKKKYYLNFSIVAISTLVLSYFLSQLDSRYLTTSHFWIPTLFLALTTLGVHQIIIRKSKEPKEFIFVYLALTMGRLLACLICVLIYRFVNKPFALAFACHFMIQYVLFTLFEISTILKNIKQTP